MSKDSGFVAAIVIMGRKVGRILGRMAICPVITIYKELILCIS